MKETDMPARKASEYLDRQQPCDSQAEIGVLGSIVLLPDVLDDVALIMRPDDFHDDAHRKLFAHMAALHEASKTIDPTLLIDQLKAAGDYEAIGGSAYLSKIIHAVPNAAHARYYAEIVAAHALRRRMILECTALLRDACDLADPQTLLADGQAAMNRLAAGVPSGDSPTALADAADRVVSDLENPEVQSRVNRAMYGVPSMDEFIGPMLGGDMTLLAARMKVGKTFLSQQVARHSALQGRPSLIINLEMGADGLAMREICRLTSIDSRTVRRGSMKPEQVALLRGAQQDIRDLPFYLWTPPKANMPQIRSVIMRAVSQQGIRLAVIDYVTLIEGTDQRLDRREQLVRISQQMKQLAREARIPLLILAQLNREGSGARDKDGYMRPPSEPRLNNVAECDAFARDADTVLFLHQEGTDQTRRKLIGAALRNAPAGSLTIRWDAVRTEFTDLEASDRANYEPAFAALNERKDF